MENNLINKEGQPVYGFHKKPFDNLNLSDFAPNGKKLSSFDILKKHKRWMFLGATNEDLVFGIAIVNLGYISNMFAYVFDRKNKSLVEFDLKQPFETRTLFHGTSKKGIITFNKGRSFGSIAISERQIILSADIKDSLSVDLKYTRAQEPLHIVTKKGIDGFNYTNKEAGLIVEGSIEVNGKKYKIKSETPSGIMDYTFGVLERKTNWNWASGSGTGSEGNVIAFNFSKGINEAEVSEDTFWINGKKIDVDVVDFEFDKANYLKQWKITSPDGNVDMIFSPEGERAMDFNVGLIRSFYHQPFGSFTGKLNDGEKEYVLKDVYGVTEDHKAVW